MTVRLPGLVLAAIATVLVAAAIPAAGAHAQEPACSFDECGLRTQAGSTFSAARLVRGRDKQRLSTLGGRLSEPAMQVFRRVEPALKRAGAYNRHAGRARLLRIGGLVILASGVAGGVEMESDPVLIGGVALGAIGIFAANSAQRRAYDAIEDAVWWYNRSLGPER